MGPTVPSNAQFLPFSERRLKVYWLVVKTCIEIYITFKKFPLAARLSAVLILLFSLFYLFCLFFCQLSLDFFEFLHSPPAGNDGFGQHIQATPVCWYIPRVIVCIFLNYDLSC